MRATVVLGAAVFLAGPGAAQNAPKLEFEVASIKPAPDNRDPATKQLRAGPQIYGTRADYLYMTLRGLVAEAYQVKGFQIACPEWFSTDHFDVRARMPAGSRREDARLMLQSLLEQRFQLAAHREFREENVAALLVSRGGHNLTESPPNGQAPASKKSGQVQPRKEETVSVSGMMGTVAVRTTLDAVNSIVRFEASRAKMADLARYLTNFGVGNGLPVVDMTGLTGEYEIALDIPIAVPPGENPNAETRGPADQASDPRGVRIARTLKSLGLELKKTRARMEYFLVDRALRSPTEN